MAKGSIGGLGKGGGGNIVFGNAQSLPLAGLTVFDDGNKTSVEATITAFEDKHFGEKNESLLMTDKDGFACGYFKGDENSVAFGLPDGISPKEITLTHTHPVGKDRSIGGTFSEADLQNHIDSGFRETRATSVEGTYRFWAGDNPRGDSFLKAYRTDGEKYARDTALKAAGAIDKKNFKSNAERKKFITDEYLKASHKWMLDNAPKYGFNYVLEPRS